MHEDRRYTIRLSGREIVSALKEAYPTKMGIQAIPVDATVASPVEGTVTISWTRAVEAMEGA